MDRTLESVLSDVPVTGIKMTLVFISLEPSELSLTVNKVCSKLHTHSILQLINKNENPVHVFEEFLV